MGMVMVVTVMPGFGRSFGNAATGQESCGNQSERCTRPDDGSRQQVLRTQHINNPSDSIATYVTSGTPVPVAMGRRFRLQCGMN